MRKVLVFFGGDQATILNQFLLNNMLRSWLSCFFARFFRKRWLRWLFFFEAAHQILSDFLDFDGFGSSPGNNRSEVQVTFEA